MSIKSIIAKRIFGNVRSTIGQCQHGRSICYYRPLKPYEPATHSLHREFKETQSLHVIEYFGIGKTNIITVGFDTYQAAMQAMVYFSTTENHAKIHRLCDKDFHAVIKENGILTAIMTGNLYRKVSGLNAKTATLKHMEYLSSIDGYAGKYTLWK
jgi:hypothetical protein